MPPPTLPTRTPIEVDVLILGGGVAGLWTLARLRKQGYSCLLLEKTALGDGQTIASQCIIHKGIKYALGIGNTGEAPASLAISRMPAIWDECLRGRGEVDLSSCRVLSDVQHLWTTPGLVSRIAGFGASKMLRSEARRIGEAERPAAFAGAPASVDVYEVPERVLDPVSLVRTLASNADSAPCIRIGPCSVAIDGGSVVGESGTARVRARAIVLAAGAGNESLLRELGCGDFPLAQQVRPLHMLSAAAAPAEIFGHCMQGSTLPRLTITTWSGPDAHGERVWSIGGGIAEEEGVARSSEAQVAFARRELGACLPWLDTASMRLRAWRIERVEGVARANAGKKPERPDEPSVARQGIVIAGWPTKLTFAPLFADRVIDLLKEAGVGPSGDRSQPQNGAHETSARIAPLPWERSA